MNFSFCTSNMRSKLIGRLWVLWRITDTQRLLDVTECRVFLWLEKILREVGNRIRYTIRVITIAERHMMNRPSSPASGVTVIRGLVLSPSLWGCSAIMNPMLNDDEGPNTYPNVSITRLRVSRKS